MDHVSLLNDHYSLKDSGLADKILGVLISKGKTLETIVPDDIKAVDEFHMGAVPASKALFDSLNLKLTDAYLDVGCGIGGPARFCACNYAVGSVDGVDLTNEYVKAANTINSWPKIAEGLTKIGAKVNEFKEGSGTALPYADASMDVVTLIHVGMNIQDKETLFAEFARVLRPGGRVGVFDQMRKTEGDLEFPVPWSSVPETSFVETPSVYKSAIEKAGLTLESEFDRTEAVLGEMAKQMAAAGAGMIPGTDDKSPVPAPDPLSLALLMGPETKIKAPNLMKKVKAGVVGPFLMIAKKPEEDGISGKCQKIE